MVTSDSPVFFYLAPRNQLANEIARLPVNAPFTHTFPNHTVYLKVGTDHVPKHPGRLISIGSNRSNCDIILPQGYPSRQCCFLVNPRTGEMLLRDDTEDQSTRLVVAGGAKYELPRTQPRQRVILGGETGASIQMRGAVFNFQWSEKNRAFGVAKTRSLVAQPTPLRSFDRVREIEHRRIRELGRGATSTVWLTIDLGTGDHLAVKVFQLHSREGEVEADIKRQVMEEVRLLSGLSHVRPPSPRRACGCFSPLTLLPLATPGCLCACTRLGSPAKAGALHGGLCRLPGTTYPTVASDRLGFRCPLCRGVFLDCRMQGGACSLHSFPDSSSRSWERWRISTAGESSIGTSNRRTSSATRPATSTWQISGWQSLRT